MPRSKGTLTPAMAQYARMKDRHKDAILFFRMGDFYETFDDDARLVSRVLGITLTARNSGTGGAEKTPLAGVPYHAVEKYIAELVGSGYKVAVCEQVEDPKKARGVVKRDVVEVVTPGTTMLAQTLDPVENNYMVALAFDEDACGLAFLDLSTGEFRTAELSEDDLLSELSRLDPAEAIVSYDRAEQAEALLKPRFPDIAISRLEEWAFVFDQAHQALLGHFEVLTLKGFGCDEMTAGVCAAGGMLVYLRETQKNRLAHLKTMARHDVADAMLMDSATQRNLELITSLRDGGRDGTLLSVMDRTYTPMGARYMRQAITRPLVSVEAVLARQEAVGELHGEHGARDEFAGLLKSMGDMERLAARVGSERANARDLIALKTALHVIPVIKEKLAGLKAGLSAGLRDGLQELRPLAEKLERALVDDPPLSLTDGGLIRSGYNEDLDDLRVISSGGKRWIAELQQKERERTGIQSLKVDYNRVFGYYIEVTKPNLHRLEGEYIRKQTMRNAERFITPELKEYEEKILGAEEKIGELEYTLFLELREEVAASLGEIQGNARAIAQLDFLTALAELAVQNDYVAPEIVDGPVLGIDDGRHPVVEQLLQGEAFVPNDTQLDNRTKQIALITGPNMAGKSTYLRQVGLIVLMAQIGSFVPARSAKIGIVDRIFTRVGASDNLARGESTFLVEMNETANILNNATPQSLVLLDEIGRGTSTFDGLSIAWAVTEFLHNTPERAAKTLFATHYHELIELASSLDRIANYNVAIREQDDQIVFLRKVMPGGSDRSYGIQVARMAGLPRSVVERARVILADLEDEDLAPDGVDGAYAAGDGGGGMDGVDGADGTGGAAGVSGGASGRLRGPGPARHGKPTAESPEYQLSLFLPADHPVVEDIKELDLDLMTPVEAMNALYRLQQKAADSDPDGA
ncbi:MAG: DNA mismatch repair protein MutS [Gemmatimonadetes bacterium]|nr:DNA mismatch repair protein MutS [Gemmatimonadota bacterium]